MIKPTYEEIEIQRDQFSSKWKMMCELNAKDLETYQKEHFKLAAERDQLIKAHDTQCEIAKQFQKLFVEVEPEMAKLTAERDGARAALEDRDKMHAEFVQKLDALFFRACAERDRYGQALEDIQSIDTCDHTLEIIEQAFASVAEGDG